MSETTRRLWDDPQRDYRARYRLPDQFTWDVAAWPRIDFDGYTAMAFDLLPSAPARVLDVGCGPGAGSVRLVEAGYDVTGVDYNDRAVAYARILAEGGRFLQGDIRALGEVTDLGDGFDAAVCIEVLEHVPPEFRDLVFHGVHAVLRPGGVFILTTPAPRMSSNAWDYRRAARQELERALADAGFELTTVRWQHRLGTAFDPRVWRLLTNRWYDLRAARHLLRRIFLTRWNAVADERRAGRYVIAARRAGD
jgi:SAM-dependent methyltransferase